MEPADLVRQVPLWALWVEILLGMIACGSAVEQLFLRRVRPGLVLAGGLLLIFGVGGLVQRAFPGTPIRERLFARNVTVVWQMPVAEIPPTAAPAGATPYGPAPAP